MNFLASLHKFSVDGDGEAKVTFKVPATDANKIVALAQMSQKLLKIEVKEEDFTTITPA